MTEFKVDINSAAQVSRATPVILAAKYSRSDVVQKLIKMGAKTSAQDVFDRSCLFYASRVGDLKSVNAILRAGAPTDDGSLLETAKNLHYEVVTALISGKHSPDFPSTKENHGGRTAL